MSCPHPALPYLWMLLGAAAFSVMAILTSLLRDRLDWQWIAMARAGLAMLFAASWAWAAGQQLVFFRPARLWMRSIAGSVSLVCGFYAMTHYPISEVLTLTNMFPLWVAILSLPLLGQWPHLDVWPAAALGLAGVALIQQPQFGGGYAAIAAALFSSLASAVALIGLHRVRDLDPRAVVAHFSAVALASTTAALVLFPRQGRLVLDGVTLGMLLGVGVSATIGQLFLTKAFAAGPPARVSVVGLSQVAFTMILEVLLHGRTFHGTTLAGIALVMLPTAWTLLRGGGPPTSEIPLSVPTAGEQGPAA